MKAFQLIYSNVLPEQSPWGKRGSHTLFYPLELMDRAQVAEIEAHIHVPKGFDGKFTVFFQELGGQHYLVMLHLRKLSEARDAIGRLGVELGQAFLFPPELWQAIPSPLGLWSLVEAAVFTDREAMLASPRVNRTTGNMEAVEIAPERVPDPLPA